jgi:uncharacterized membrane protein YdfJ with MMPL/SSD domain
LWTLWQSVHRLTSARDASIIGSLVTAVRPLPHVLSVSSPLVAGAGDQLSANSKIGFAVTFDTTDAWMRGPAAADVIGTARHLARPGLKVAVGGAPADNVVTVETGSSEDIGIAAAFIIMLVALRSAVAMGLSLLTALSGVGMGFEIVFAASHVLTVPTYGPGLMAMIGLGVRIYYALPHRPGTARSRRTVAYGPYAVAELRTSDLLASHGAIPPPGGMRLYVTDTLDDPYAAQIGNGAWHG